MSFQNVKHQKRAADVLKRLLEAGRLPHAMLFVGPKDAGELPMAREIAKSLFCASPKNADSCDECANCRRVEQNTHPDFVLIAPEEGAASIKVEAVREVIARANLKPFEAPCKFFVIDQAELMNEVAQNAFLKTLEEPQGRTYFVLITQAPDKLLNTIRSRCQTHYFVAASNSAEADEEVRAAAKEVTDFLVYDLPAKKSAFAAPDLSKLDRESLKKVLDELILYFRDILLVQNECGELLSDARYLPEKQRLAKSFAPDALVERIEFISRMKEKLQEMANAKIVTALFWEEMEQNVR